jgi:hypothetical protein
MVELLVALAVTTIGLTGVVAMHTSSARANRLSKETTAATSICERTMEQLRAMSIDEIVATLGEGELPFETVLTDVDAGHVSYARLLSGQEVEDNPGLVKLRIDVDWTEAGGDPGESGGRFDHTITLEVVRTKLELL